ncbi:PatA/PatG family cyanobactin maturation protease [Roseofilum sp. Belize Diploria]|uniref:PatA/PatG family cyanobactin maturation protease n=1 Tax=Roseofilum sp. Belize Diploria TaxID=2821501 RepID=UPI001B179DAA|nr:PatA/PatG family cyanobactin maturation protease [Roseofilum sp. Belize Diploria]MBP0009253.1 PatA/PatG family cyanobactin maturation protease [Roseofilum sp. Belize Diploria]
MTDLQTHVTNISALPGLKQLWSETKGNPEICVAILDGPVDLSHPCFEGANLETNSNAETASTGVMSGHGTHITSVIFGQHGSPVSGIAPGCRGLILPVFSDRNPGLLSQLDLARQINQAVAQGARVINISGGQLAEANAADPMLAKAVQSCHDSGVLIVAAAGNDGCSCLHVPAALPGVLAVGAMNAEGLPFDFSNWGEAYQTQGILAPGEDILGAEPEGGTTTKSGTSFATPIISGIVALLLSVQLEQGQQPDPQSVRDAILQSAVPCQSEAISNCDRFLAGRLDLLKAYALITQGGTNKLSIENLPEPIGNPSEANEQISAETSTDIAVAEVTPSEAVSEPIHPLENVENPMTVTPSQLATPSVTPSNVVPSEDCGCNGSSAKPIVYVTGTVSYDFGTEARRDSFKQLMPMVEGDPPFPANPFVVSQMADYLEQNPYESKSLIWTLNLELTPIYAIEPTGAYTAQVYEQLISALKGQIEAEDAPEYVSRISVPGVLTGKSVRLFSGQVVPVIAPEIRGMYEWNVNQLVNLAVEAAKADASESEADEQEEATRTSLKEFLQRMYYEFRNLGQTSQERALNFAATNAFQAAQALTEATGKGMQLDRIETEKSPFCRMDSDCWDVKLKFFDPENDRRAKKVFRFTVDVSDTMPVTIGEMRSWSISN